MAHYPNHERRAFLDWIADGCPDTATWEEDYEQHQIPADDLLRNFLLPAGCTDIMPKDACRHIAGRVGIDGDISGITYAIGAMTLLVARAVGDDAADRFLARLLRVDEGAW